MNLTPWSGSNLRAAVSSPTLPSPMRSMRGSPRFWYFLATEMTKRRLRLTSSWSASWSPARIFFARSISSVPLSSGYVRHLVEVLVEDVAFGFVRSDPSGGRAAASTLEFGHDCGLSSRPGARLESYRSLMERRPKPTIPRYGLLCCTALLFRCAAVHSTRAASDPIDQTDQTHCIDTTRTLRSELRKALQNTGLSDLRQSQFVDTRVYPRLYLVVPVERLVTDDRSGGQCEVAVRVYASSA